jgi:hypothetical protein
MLSLMSGPLLGRRTTDWRALGVGLGGMVIDLAVVVDLSIDRYLSRLSTQQVLRCAASSSPLQFPIAWVGGLNFELATLSSRLSASMRSRRRRVIFIFLGS